MENQESGGPDPVTELDRQLERASLFTHASFERIARRSSGIQAELHQLVEVLRDKGVLADDELPPPAPVLPQTDVGTPEEPHTMRWPAIALRAENPVPKPAVEVNCAERMPVCHAVCCKLSFALSASEVERGKVRFDLGFPYTIRHDADGYCTHNDRGSGFCKVYADRPGVCGHYSCAGDTRIWKDFDAMELNQEWLDANLGDTPPIHLRMQLPMMDSVSYPEDSE